MIKRENRAIEKYMAILDSKHIITTSPTTYNLKLIECGSYIQVYCYDNKKKRKQKDNSDLNLKNVCTTQEDNEKKEIKKIEERSIIRSKLECQRLAKSNMEHWETFITLTFKDNIKDVDIANKQFRYFVDKIKRVKKDFMYLCVPEFQKRGAVHYHLLTNISLDSKLIYSQENNEKYKHIKYWNEGFDRVDKITGDVKKIVGYISKYMTKDIDNRLFGHRRYFYSRNLKRPRENYINLDNEREYDFYKEKIQGKQLIFQKDYQNLYDNSKVTFFEYLK